MNKKQVLCFVNLLAILVLLTYFGMLSLLHTPPTSSQVERRDLAARPEFSLASFFAHTFTHDFDLFYADTFPARENFIKLSYALEEQKGISGEVKMYNTGVQEQQKPLPPSSSSLPAVLPPSSSLSSSSGTSAPSSAASSSQPASQSESVPPPPPSSTEPEATGDAYQNNNIFIYQNAAYQLFYGGHQSAENYAKVVSSYAAELPGVTVYNQVIPQPYNFYLPQRYKKIGKSEEEYADYLQSQYTNGVRGIRAYQKLAEHKSEYLYFRTDTHWTARGAYAAYLAFCDAAKVTPVPLDAMEKRTIPGSFLGYLYTLTQDKNLEAMPDTVEYFIVPGITKVECFTDRGGADHLQTLPSLWQEDCRGGNSYSVFIYGDQPYMRVTTTAGTGRSALLIKDSYGNAFAPYLASHYDTLHIIDERYYPYSVYDLIQQQGIDDVIISNSSYSAATASHQQNLQDLKKGHTDKPLPDFDAPPPVQP
ncbi:MAG: DHHW family protein [Angelakisella sp.]